MKGWITLKRAPWEDGFTRKPGKHCPIQPWSCHHPQKHCSSGEARAAEVHTQERNGTVRPSPGVHWPAAETPGRPFPPALSVFHSYPGAAKRLYCGNLDERLHRKRAQAWCKWNQLASDNNNKVDFPTRIGLSLIRCGQDITIFLVYQKQLEKGNSSLMFCMVIDSKPGSNIATSFIVNRISFAFGQLNSLNMWKWWWTTKTSFFLFFKYISLYTFHYLLC